MKRLINHWIWVALWGWAVTGWVACSEPVDIPNSPPTVTLSSLTADQGVLEIYYEIEDSQGDDVDVSIEVCILDSCSVPSAAPGGDGIRNLPSHPDQPLLHLFRWAAACDIPVTDFDRERTLRITPRDEQVGQSVRSDSFSLSEIGVIGGTDACNDVFVP